MYGTSPVVLQVLPLSWSGWERSATRKFAQGVEILSMNLSAGI